MRTNLATDALPSLLAKLTIPSLIALLAGSLYSITDSIFLGRAVGELALAGLEYASCSAQDRHLYDPDSLQMSLPLGELLTVSSHKTSSPQTV